MNHFRIKTYIPTLSSFGATKELTNLDLLKINKFINYKDDINLSLFFKKMVSKNIETNFDLAFAIINLRMLCVGEEIKIADKTEGKVSSTIKIKLRSILTRILENPQNPLPPFNYNDLTIKFSLPKRLYYNNFISFLLDIVEDISIDNKLSYKNLKIKERYNLLIKLKKNIINEIKKHIQLHQIKYKIIVTEENNLLSNTTFSFYDNSCYYLIKFLFKNSLSSTYNKLFHCSQKLYLGYNDFCNLSPAETDLLLAIFKKNNNIK